MLSLRAHIKKDIHLIGYKKKYKKGYKKDNIYL